MLNLASSPGSSQLFNVARRITGNIKKWEDLGDEVRLNLRDTMQLIKVYFIVSFGYLRSFEASIQFVL